VPPCSQQGIFVDARRCTMTDPVQKARIWLLRQQQQHEFRTMIKMSTVAVQNLTNLQPHMTTMLWCSFAPTRLTSGTHNPQHTTIIHHGRVGLLSFLCLSNDSPPDFFSYYRSMPWIDSTKKIQIQWKMASRNGRFTISITKCHIRRFLHHGEEKRRMSFGIFGIFVYRFVKCLNHGVIRTFEKAANKKKPSADRFPPYDGYFRHGRNRSLFREIKMKKVD
jgi:hypothetical protein